MTRFNPEKVLILYSVIGRCSWHMLHWLQVSARSMSPSGKCFVWPLLGDDLCRNTGYIDNEHTEMAGAVIVMAIVGARWFRQFRDILQICSTHYSFHPGFYALLCLCRSLLLA